MIKTRLFQKLGDFILLKREKKLQCYSGFHNNPLQDKEEKREKQTKLKI